MTESSSQANASSKPGLRKKLKGVFVVEGNTEETTQNTAELLNQQKHDELLAEYDRLDKYITQAVLTNDKDFLPSVDAAHLQGLRAQIEEARADADSFSDRLLQMVMNYFPVLITLLMTLPYESELKDRIQELWDRLKTGDFQGSFAQHASELLETTAQQLPVAQMNDLSQIEQLIAQQQAKAQESREVLRNALTLYQETITQLVQQQQNTLITPEDYAAQVAKVIKEYEGWAGKSDTPASDDRDAQRLVANVTTYKEQYDAQQKAIEEQQLQNTATLQRYLNEYVDLITSTHDYLIIKQQSARENYIKQSRQQTSLAEKARLYTHTVKTVVTLRQEFVQDISPAKLFLQSVQSKRLDLDLINQIHDLDSMMLISPKIMEQQTLAKDRFHAHCTQAFNDYQQTSNVHNLNKLRALQKLLTQKYQEIISITSEYQELEHNITTSGEKLAFTDTLRSIPHRPQLPFDATKELGWSAEQLRELMQGFVNSSGLPPITITSSLGETTFSAKEGEQLQQLIQEMLEEATLGTTASQQKGIGKYSIQYDATTQEIVLRHGVPDTLLAFRTHFSSEIKNTDKPLAEIIAIGETMQTNGEFFTSERAGLQVSNFKLSGFTGGFATSDSLWKQSIKNPQATLSTHMYNCQTLAPGSRACVKLQSIRSNDINEWKEPVRTVMLGLETQGIRFDHMSTYKVCIQALQSAKGLTENDAMVLYMYLTGQYGYYRTGKYSGDSRGYVGLNDDSRRFDAGDSDGRYCSLLFAVD